MPHSTSLQKHPKGTSSFLAAAMFMLLAPPSAAQAPPSKDPIQTPGTELRITLPVNLPGTQVRIDGVLLDPSSPLSTTGGEHAIRIESEGAFPIEGTLTLSTGRNHLLEITEVQSPLPPLEIATFATAALGTALLISSVILEQTLDFDEPQREDELLIGMMGGAALSLVASGAFAANIPAPHETEASLRTLSWRLIVLAEPQR